MNTRDMRRRTVVFFYWQVPCVDCWVFSTPSLCPLSIEAFLSVGICFANLACIVNSNPVDPRKAQNNASNKADNEAQFSDQKESRERSLELLAKIERLIWL